MLNLRSAPLPAGLRNFSLDLACGVLPTGLGIKFVDEKTCLYCHAVKDTAWHFVDECVYLRPLRQWYADVWTAMSWPLPLPSFGRFLVYGYAPRVGDYTAALALHGALLAAAQYARYTLTGRHLPAASARIVARAQERLMYHLRLDTPCIGIAPLIARGGARKILEVGASAAHDDEQTRASGTGEGAR
jgi:hypothetical protein